MTKPALVQFTVRRRGRRAAGDASSGLPTAEADVTYQVDRAREGVRSSAGFATSQRVPGWGFTADETIPGCRFTARGAGGGKPAHMSAA